jgi:hypothetical protein
MLIFTDANANPGFVSKYFYSYYSGMDHIVVHIPTPEVDFSLHLLMHGNTIFRDGPSRACIYAITHVKLNVTQYPITFYVFAHDF